MRKTELTKGQQKKFKWLMDADTVDEDVEVSKFGDLIQKSGTWKDGIWDRGTWENGTWKDGIWGNGVWKGGLMWSNLKQRNVHVKWDEDKEEFEEDMESGKQS